MDMANNYYDDAAEISKMMKIFTNHAQQLKASFTEVDKTIAQISETMDTNSEGISQVAASTTEFTSVLQGINHEIENCDRISDKMRESLLEFRKE